MIRLLVIRIAASADRLGYRRVPFRRRVGSCRGTVTRSSSPAVVDRGRRMRDNHVNCFVTELNWDVLMGLRREPELFSVVLGKVYDDWFRPLESYRPAYPSIGIVERSGFRRGR